MTREEYISWFRERYGRDPDEIDIAIGVDSKPSEKKEVKQETSALIEEKSTGDIQASTEDKSGEVAPIGSIFAEEKEEVNPVGSILESVLTDQSDRPDGLFNPHIEKAINGVYDGLNIQRKSPIVADKKTTQFLSAIVPGNENNDYVAPKDIDINSGDAGILDVLGAGVGSGVIDNATAAASGDTKDRSQEYQLHSWKWGDVTSGKVFSREMAKDLAFITGKNLVDIPVFVGLNIVFPGSGFAAMIGAGALFGGADVMADKAAHNEEIKLKDVALGSALNAVTLGAGAGAGGATRFLTKAAIGTPVKKVAEEIAESAAKRTIATPIMSAINSVNQRVLPQTIDKVSKGLGYVANIGTMEKVQAKMEGRDTSPLGLASNIALDAGMKVGKMVGAEFKNNKNIEPERVHELDQIAKEEHKNYVVEENARKYVESAQGDPFKAVQNFARDYRNVVESLNIKKKRTVGEEAFIEAKNREDSFKDHVKAIEEQTGQKTGYLDESGEIKDKRILLSRKELADAVEQGTWDGVESYVLDNPFKRDMMQEQMILNDYLNYAEADKNIANKKIMTELGNRDSFIGSIDDRRRSAIQNEKIDKWLNDANQSPDDIAAIKQTMDMPERSMSLIAKYANKYVTGRVGKWLDAFRISDPIYNKKMGAAVEKFLMRPFRILDNFVMQKKIEFARELDKQVGKMSQKELREAEIYIIGVQKKNTKNGLENAGLKVLDEYIAKKIIEPTEIKSWDQLSDKSKALIESIFAGNREVWTHYNNARDVLGQEHVKGVGHEFVPLYSKDGSLDFASDRNMLPWFIQEKMKKSDIKVGDQEKRVDPKDVDLNIIPSVLAYRDFMLRQSFAAPVAAKMQQFARHMREAGHNQSADYLESHAKYLAGEVVDPLNSWIKKHLPKFSQWLYTSQLCLSVNSMVSNATSFAATMAEFGIERTLRSAEKVLDYRLGISDDCNINLSHMLKGAISNPEYESIIAGVSDKGMRRYTQKGARIGTAGMRFFDLVNRAVTFETAFDFYREKGWSEEDAKWKADNEVAALQASGSRLDTPKVLRTTIGRAVFSFSTYPITYLNYLASRATNLEPVYKCVEYFGTKEEAQKVADSNSKYVFDEAPAYNDKGEQTGTNYYVYDKQKANKSLQMMWKLIVLGLVAESSSILNQAIKEEIGLPMRNPNTAPISRMFEEYTGKNYYQALKGVEGDKPANRRVQKDDGSYRKETKGEKIRRVAGSGILEAAGAVPVLGSVVNFGDGSAGSVASTVNKIGKDVQQVVQYGKAVDMAKTANDITSLFGNPLYQPGRYAINYWKEYQKDIKEAAAEKRKQQKHTGRSNKWEIKKLGKLGKLGKL